MGYAVAVRSWWALACIALFACRETRPLPLAGAPDDLYIAAFIDATGTVFSAQRIDVNAPFAAPAGRDVITFVVPRAKLITAEGGEVSAEALASARVRIALQSSEPGLGECGRCLAPPGDPIVVNSGDSCPVARTIVGVGGSDEQVERVRAQVRIDWPGACPCGAPPAAPSPRIAFRTVTPSVDAWPVRATAIALDGAVGLFSHHYAAVVAPDGQRVARTRTSSSTWCEPETPALPFEGTIIAAGAAPDGRFLVVSRVPGERDRAVHVVGRDLSFQQLRLEPENLLVQDIISFGAQLYVVGELRLTSRGVFACAIVGDKLACTAAAGGDLLTGATDPPKITRTTDGVLIAAAQGGGFAYADTNMPAPQWVNRPQGRLALPDGTVTGLNEIASLSTIGDRAFVCTHTPGVARAIVVTASVTVASATATEPPTWHIVYAGALEAHCAGVTTPIGQPDRQRFGLSDGTVVDVDRFGVVHESQDTLRETVGIDRPVVRFDSVGRTPGLAFDNAGGVIRRIGDRYDLVYGSAPPTWSLASVIVDVGAEYWVFGDGPPVRRISLDTAGNPVQDILRIDGFSAGDRVLAAVYDSSRDGFLVAGIGPESFLRRVDRSMKATEVPVPELPPDTRFLDLVEVAPDVFLLVAERGVLLRLRGDDATAVVPTWDDPTTPEPESRSERACVALRPIDRRGSMSAIYRAGAAAAGSAWVVGCDGLLMRVHPFAEPPTAIRVGGARQPDLTAAPPEFLAVAASCADSVVLAAPAGGLSSESGKVFEVYPSDASQIAVRAYGPAESSQLGFTREAAGQPLAVLIDGSRVSTAFTFGRDIPSSLVRYLGERTSFDFDAYAVAQSPAGDLLIGGAFGQLVYGRECPP